MRHPLLKSAIVLVGLAVVVGISARARGADPDWKAVEHALGKESFDRLLAGAKAVAIGPTTARELVARGHAPVLTESASLRGLALATFRLVQTRQ